MLAADTGVSGFLVAGMFGALGPFFLAGLLDEKTGVWLSRKNDRPAPITSPASHLTP